MGDERSVNASFGLKFRCTWVFAKALVQGELREQDWVLMHHLNRMGVALTAGTQAVPGFWHLLVLLTSSVQKKQACSPQGHLCHDYYIRIRGFISTGLIALPDIRHLYSRIKTLVWSSRAKHYSTRLSAISWHSNTLKC